MPLYRTYKPFPVSPGVAVSGKYYGPAWQVTNGSRVMVTDTAFYTPVLVPVTATFDRISTEVTAAGTTAVLALGLYLPDGVGGLPKTLLLDAGQVSVSGTGEIFASIAAGAGITLPAGLIWVCVAQASAVGACTLRATGGQSVTPHIPGSSVTDITQGNAQGYSKSTAGITVSLPPTALTPTPGAGIALGVLRAK